MLNLTNVFQWVINRLNQDSFTQENLIHQLDQLLLYFLVVVGD
jgi:hypothetical protein